MNYAVSEWSAGAENRSFNEACHLFGDECKDIKENMIAGNYDKVKELLNKWDLPLSCKVHAVRLTMCWSLDKSKNWVEKYYV